MSYNLKNAKATSLSYRAWCKLYIPIKSPFGENRSYGGALFETLSPDIDFVKKQQGNHIWTLTEIGRAHV